MPQQQHIAALERGAVQSAREPITLRLARLEIAEPGVEPRS